MFFLNNPSLGPIIIMHYITVYNNNNNNNFYFYCFLPLVLDSQGLRNYLKNYKTLGASRLVQKLCWMVSK